jgi:post-segregation antitoxin (ccd killing protein)
MKTTRVRDKKAVLTASVRMSLLARLADESKRRGVNVSALVDEAISAYFDRGCRNARTGRVTTVGPDDQDQGV